LKKALIMMIVTVLIFIALPSGKINGDNDPAARITLSAGVISNPINNSESAFFKKLTVDSSFDKPSGVYLLQGSQEVDGCSGDMAGTYDPITRQLKGEYFYVVSIGPKTLSVGDTSEIYTLTGTFSGVMGYTGNVALMLTGTQKYDKWNAAEDDKGFPLYKDFLEETETTSSTREVTFTVAGLEAEIMTAPTIELLILDGPVAFEEGKLRWTVKANVSGNPAPTVEFSGNPGDGISATSNENVVNITVERGKIFELTATASNWNSVKTAVMTFVNEDSGARFSDISGEVSIRAGNNEEAWRNVELETVLMVDDHIQTGPNSTCIISFADMTTFVMKPQSEIILSSSAAKDTMVKVLAGNLWINIKKMMKDGSIEIECSQAVAGIKGTILILSDTGTETTIKVIDGTVQFELLDSSKSVMVNKGESVTASQNGLSEKTTFEPAEEEKSWEAIGAITPGKIVEIGESEVNAATESGTREKAFTGSRILIIIIIVAAFLLAAVIVTLVFVFRSRKNRLRDSGR
jgi:hypothetical protein